MGVCISPYPPVCMSLCVSEFFCVHTFCIQMSVCGRVFKCVCARVGLTVSVSRPSPNVSIHEPWSMELWRKTEQKRRDSLLQYETHSYVPRMSPWSNTLMSCHMCNSMAGSPVSHFSLVTVTQDNPQSEFFSDPCSVPLDLSILVNWKLESTERFLRQSQTNFSPLL